MLKTTGIVVVVVVIIHLYFDYTYWKSQFDKVT